LIDFIGAGVNFQGFGFHFDHGLRASPKDRSGRIFCPCGGAMLIRRDVFLEVGGFDGDYFSFYEDTDLGWRLNLFGHTVWYASDAIVFHRHHGSFDRVHAHRRRVLYERNALFTMYKCLDDANLAVALPASLLLLNEKALSMARLDIGGFLMNAAPPPAVVDAGEQSTESRAAKVRRVLADEGPLAVVERAAWIPLRRWRRWRSQQRRSIRPGRDFPMPLAALACLVGLSEFGRSLDALKVKRTWVQARRQRSDEEILPLFYFALEPSYHEDPAYIDFHWHVVRALGLDRRFGRGHLHRPA
jgi:glycosyl transferase family 2